MKTNINDIHYMADIIMAGVETACGCVMMSGSNKWSSWFTQWGHTPVVYNKGFVNLTIDPSQVTCKKCKQIIDGVKSRPDPFKVKSDDVFSIKKPESL